MKSLITCLVAAPICYISHSARYRNK